MDTSVAVAKDRFLLKTWSSDQLSITKVFLLTFCFFVSLNALFAQNAPPEDGLWYYELGGAKAVPRPANPDVSSFDVDASASLNLGYSCLKFDPVVGVAHTLNQVKDGAEDMLQAMTDAATGAIASLPALILQRANPGMYDLMQNALARAQLKVDLATKSCQQIETEMAKGQNPYQDLVVLSKGNDWKRQMGVGGANIVTVQDQVENSNGSNGVPWVFGSDAGGSGQAPIRLTGDLVQAGYNVNLNRSITDTSDVSSLPSSRVVQIWDSPSDAQEWVVDVVGEHQVTTCEGCDKTSTPSLGLLVKQEEERKTLESKLETIVADTNPPTVTELAEISAPGVVITRQVIDSLKELDEIERSLLLQRLVDELAVSRTLEKAFYGRRLLKAGTQLPEIKAVKMAQEHGEKAVKDLDAETERMLFEYRLRKEVVSETASILILRAMQRQQESRTIPERRSADPNLLIEGRVEH